MMFVVEPFVFLYLRLIEVLRLRLFAFGLEVLSSLRKIGILGKKGELCRFLRSFQKIFHLFRSCG